MADQLNQKTREPGQRPNPGTRILTHAERVLAVVVLIAIGLGWYVAADYRNALREALIKSYQETQLEIVRAVARNTSLYVEEKLREGESIGAIEQEIFEQFVAPIHLLENGDAWIYAPDHVVFDESSDFPDSYRGKSVTEIFASQVGMGASHYEEMARDIVNGREGVGWYVWLPEKGEEIGAWTPVRFGSHLWTIGLSTPLNEILQTTGARRQTQFISFVMGAGSLLMALLTGTVVWTVGRRKRLDVQLRRSNEELTSLVRDLQDEIQRRKDTEEALQEVNGRLNTLVEAIPDIIYFKNTEGRHLIVNRAFEALTGEERESIIGRTDSDLLPPELAAQCARSDELVLRNRCPLQTGETLIGPDGQTTYFESHKVPLFDKDGVVIGIVGVSRDISDYKRAEVERERLTDQLIHAQKMEAVGLLAGGVAHDLNNILTGLVTYPELLLTRLPDDSPLRKPILTIQHSGERAAGIVQDLLILSRRSVSQREVTNLNLLVGDYLRGPAHRKLMSDHPDITEEIVLAKNLLFILGSCVDLSKSIQNLVFNAVEAMSDGGVLHISTENCYVDHRITGMTDVSQGEYVKLTVSDSGQEIPKEALQRIFEPFYVRKVLGRRGTGLGLAVAWGTVQEHEGYINVRSRSGEGTAFELYFPVTQVHGKRAAPPTAEGGIMGKGEMILVVDDVEEQREIASEMLGCLGYRVNVAASGEEAVDFVRDQRPDLVILDMIMTSGMDGLDTYREMIKIRPGLKAVITSGYSETKRVKEAQRLGAGAYVPKPYLMEVIAKAIRQELDR